MRVEVASVQHDAGGKRTFDANVAANQRTAIDYSATSNDNFGTRPHLADDSILNLIKI